MATIRLDRALAQKQLVATRSQAESWIKLGKVTVDGAVVRKPGFFVSEKSKIALKADERYVSRAGLKLASVAKVLGVGFVDKIVLDVGSSTGGFTDYALQHGATKVYAVDVGTDQLHPSLRQDSRIELHEKTDIRDFAIPQIPDVVMMDVSFVSLRNILPVIYKMSDENTQIIAMVKPQFEAQRDQIGGSGVVKNDRIRREILKSFELWVKDMFVIKDKADSEVAGAAGNKERFYYLQKTKTTRR